MATRLMALVLGATTVMLTMNPASADAVIKINRNCSLIEISVTAPAEGSYELRGRRQFGEEAGQVNTWAAHYEKGERMSWKDTSFSTVTYSFVLGHAGNPDSKVVAVLESQRTNC